MIIDKNGKGYRTPEQLQVYKDRAKKIFLPGVNTWFCVAVDSQSYTNPSSDIGEANYKANSLRMAALIDELHEHGHGAKKTVTNSTGTTSNVILNVVRKEDIKDTVDEGLHDMFLFMSKKQG